MVTLWDWLTVSIFIGLAITYLNRSIGEVVPSDRIVHYIAPAALLALANCLGNDGREYLATVAVMCATGIFLYLIKPFRVD
ncbi:MAG: XrtV sorting system accessory protein [Pseudomonadota bacterium]